MFPIIESSWWFSSFDWSYSSKSSSVSITHLGIFSISVFAFLKVIFPTIYSWRKFSFSFLSKEKLVCLTLVFSVLGLLLPERNNTSLSLLKMSPYTKRFLILFYLGVLLISSYFLNSKFLDSYLKFWFTWFPGMK